MENKIDSQVVLDNRNSLKVTGATKLYYSTQNESMIETSVGKLIITGSDINVTKVAIDNNLVELAGKFNSIKYTTTDKTTKTKGIFSLRRG